MYGSKRELIIYCALPLPETDELLSPRFSLCHITALSELSSLYDLALMESCTSGAGLQENSS